MADAPILVDHPEPGVAVVTLNRPAQRNALTLAMWRELAATMDRLGAEPDLRAIVLTGAGGCFSAGADIKEFEKVRATVEAGAAYAEAVDRCNDAIRHAPKATFAAVSGPAYGGGCGLALCCDFRIADRTASFAIPAAKLSIVYGLAETRAVLQAVGAARAKEVLFTGRRFEAEEAATIGLATHLSESDALSGALAEARALGDKAPLSIAGAKLALAVLTEGRNAEREAAFAAMRARALASEDYKEGVRAFAEKRPPRFTGR
jgi:enoyl-CoA hydratase/carnithine racemase